MQGKGCMAWLLGLVVCVTIILILVAVNDAVACPVVW